ncbi:hypothetical protein OG429_32400 [Streptomyces sp. NBC_00190]|uniref:hypothetical protein n=1 Tax=unclassified Streptomyces TaxID=2593676 RepID=UPI002E2AAD53|nr:hypothetical protein [Streptomyces sp. NBC_00190]WSZ43564.1 hypothetical protein OG239_34890 [Streptomyces sp. NBC_00868]
MKRSIKSLVLRKAAILVAVGCAASLFSVAVSHQDAPAPEHTVTVLAGGPIDPTEWNSQG